MLKIFYLLSLITISMYLHLSRQGISDVATGNRRKSVAFSESKWLQLQFFSISRQLKRLSTKTSHDVFHHLTR